MFRLWDCRNKIATENDTPLTDYGIDEYEEFRGVYSENVESKVAAYRDQCRDDYDLQLSHFFTIKLSKINEILEEYERQNPIKAKSLDYKNYKRNLTSAIEKIADSLTRPDNNTTIAKAQKRLLDDLLKAAQINTSIWEKISEFVISLIVGLTLGWAIGIVLPTLVGMKLLGGSVVLGNLLQSANSLLAIPQAQMAYGACTAAALYSYNKFLNWMAKPTTAEIVSEKVINNLNSSSCPF